MELDAEKLIVLIEARPVVYNNTLKEHHDRDLIDKVWVEIAKDMDATVADCRWKWTVLRNSYARHLRDIKKVPSVSSASKKKKWYLADSLAFLQNFIGQHRKMGSNITVDTEPNEDSANEDNGSIETTEAEINRPLKAPRTKKMTPADMVAGPMIEFLKSRTTGSDRKKFDNPHMNFFKSLVPDVEKLTSRRQRKFKEKVMAVLNDFLDKQESEATFLRSGSSSSACSPVPVHHMQSLLNQASASPQENVLPSHQGQSKQSTG